MPMHPSWEKIQENFKQQYGDRWEEVFWAWMNEHGYDETEPAEGQIKGEECKKEEERHYGKPRTDEERAMRHFGLTEEEWNELTEDEKNELISQLPSRGTGLGAPKKEEGGEEMVIEYLEQLIKEMEEALDQLENALEKKRISELPTT